MNKILLKDLRQCKNCRIYTKDTSIYIIPNSKSLNTTSEGDFKDDKHMESMHLCHNCKTAIVEALNKSVAESLEIKHNTHTVKLDKLY